MSGRISIPNLESDYQELIESIDGQIQKWSEEAQSLSGEAKDELIQMIYILSENRKSIEGAYTTYRIMANLSLDELVESFSDVYLITLKFEGIQ